MVAALIGSVPLTSGAAVASEPASTGATVLPAKCVRRVGALYETRTQATIDKLGKRYALTVHCNGVHTIYVRVPAKVDLEAFVGKSVRARYRYVNEKDPSPKCLREPCPPVTLRLVEITELRETPGPAHGAKGGGPKDSGAKESGARESGTKESPATESGK